MAGAVYDYVKRYRERLDAPNILEGMRLQRLAQEFWQETSNPGTALERPIERLGASGPGLQFVALWNANYGGRRIDESDSVEEKQEVLDAMKREADVLLSMLSSVENQRGVLGMKGMSKEGLSTLPPELQREVIGFLSPGGRAEDTATAISRFMVERGGPGVRSDVEVGRSVPRPRGPPGPAAAGAGGPAGGKRRRKTRKGRSRRRYSRRR